MVYDIKIAGQYVAEPAYTHNINWSNVMNDSQDNIKPEENQECNRDTERKEIGEVFYYDVNNLYDWAWHCVAEYFTHK